MPSPCGNNAQCRVVNKQASCSCVMAYIGSPPNCRPECTINAECSSNLACINEKCRDPCPGSCGISAICSVENHTPICSCPSNYMGDPFTACVPRPALKDPIVPKDPCYPSPCGSNAVCNNGQCKCLPEYQGNPYVGCRPECVLNTDCPRDKACIRNKCEDPCLGTCGIGALCETYNHVPMCRCPPAMTGNAFVQCLAIETPVLKTPTYPCKPSPCGPNSQCREFNEQATCSCLPNYLGSPPDCRPECSINSDCPPHLACVNQKCLDPCPGSCGIRAKCSVVNHAPYCQCPPGYTGNAFVMCQILPPPPIKIQQENLNPCIPSPCGPSSECKVDKGSASCSCISNYTGAPPYCRPECISSSECPSNLACINMKCQDPCPGVCGKLAVCHVVSHIPSCVCASSYIGDPFTLCYPPPQIEREQVNPCSPSPCGSNAKCRELNGAGSCQCLPDYYGNPYEGCRPECVLNTDCPANKACQNQKCRDPCPGVCGQNAMCNVINHLPACSCYDGYTGDPYSYCNIVREPIRDYVNPCQPSPCGFNSQCRVVNEQAICSCLPEYIGFSPNCRPECTVNSECPAIKACVNQKCQDPCKNVCGYNAECRVMKHSPMCRCSAGFTGDAFSRCSPIPALPPPLREPYRNPCVPSPCGQYAQCRLINDNQPTCSCLPTYVGSPPNCRPECVINSDCSSYQACISERCKDPCPGSCGFNALCSVINHIPSCVCPEGYFGDPFSRCIPKTQVFPSSSPIADEPCQLLPCGPNSECRNNACSCLPDYRGDPYRGCRPECILNSECSRDKACVNKKCVDPCPGTCAANAICEVHNHVPMCYCSENMEGDAFTMCRPKQKLEIQHQNPCFPSPCGPNSYCRDTDGVATCSCLPDMIGTPPSCRPQCITDSECPSSKACVNRKCQDPCPGSCGYQALCHVINHNPLCTCSSGYTGSPFVECQPIIIQPQRDTIPQNPCIPSPCGPYSQCENIHGGASCKCLPDYVGIAPYCRPECISNSECSANMACINEKCKDPCPGVCGNNTVCRTVNHIAMCICLSGYIGDPFNNCQPDISKKHYIRYQPHSPHVPEPPNYVEPQPAVSEKPYHPRPTIQPTFSPQPPDYVQPRPPNYVQTPNSPNSTRRPVISEDSQGQPPTTHRPTEGLPTQHEPYAPEYTTPCKPNPCGPNAECRSHNNAGSCACLQKYVGNPYEGCRPECVLNSDCPSTKACIQAKCQNPCPGTCGQNALCHVTNHLPTCTCYTGFTGDPYSICLLIKQKEPIVYVNPCQPTPCGPNSQCREISEQAVCSCLPDFVGLPPACRPECTTNGECPLDKACINRKCLDPCSETCGLNAECRVLNHIPMCSCLPSFTGDAFGRCYSQPSTTVIVGQEEPSNPCYPSPCGQYAQCHNRNGAAICSCLQNFIGSPPHCRPECLVNSDCPSHLTCINEKCLDPCPGSCGYNAMCNVLRHIPNCVCESGTTGDPFTGCYSQPVVITSIPVVNEQDPCIPSPCGVNAKCERGNCSCLLEYYGDPYVGCRPECILNSDCSRNRACINTKCQDPCPETCGKAAECNVVNHTPMCSCPNGMTGNPFIRCEQIVQPIRQNAHEHLPQNPCQPSPCGPNAQCKKSHQQAVCSCLTGFLGSPPSCRPECTSNSDCSGDKYCLNQKCKDVCAGACGIIALCHVNNHVPMCSCPPKHTGNPFVKCSPIAASLPTSPPKADIPTNPCQPSPCGPYSQCTVDSSVNSAKCLCLDEFIGQPPRCRPECINSADCSSDKACINRKCSDPCPGSCGEQAECRVLAHSAMCYCPGGFTGDPFLQCVRQQEPPTEVVVSCSPSPCGPNAMCRVHNDLSICQCLPDFYGNPYEACRPECLRNSDCAANKACQNQKCHDPCPGACGHNAHCHVVNHIPNCACLTGHQGDAYSICIKQLDEPKPAVYVNPCQPSPCGANSQCREVNEQAVCSCLPDFVGSPPACRPECVVSSECATDKACINQKCQDPCPGSCGINAECHVRSHSPLCTCKPGYTGEAFTRCHIIPERKEDQPPALPFNPCLPSPCGPYSQCREVNLAASCSCLPNYIGAAPNCRPECTINAECVSNMACINEKCRNPCPGSCGFAALCNVINHTPSCSCQVGYTGDPFTSCRLLPPPVPQKTKDPVDPCIPSPCGSNSLCHNGQCSCLPEYHGDPNVGCRPECVLNSDCARNRACVRNKCIDPCPGTCGQNALCEVNNHISMCRCPERMTGNAFVLCEPIREEIPKNPCQPSPCGPNSQCMERNGNAICSCITGYLGNPPNCRLECYSSSDCSPIHACINNKCVDPCPGKCGLNAECQAVQHRAHCECLRGFEGNPYTACKRIEILREPPVKPKDPCFPSPCGLNSQCSNVNNQAKCQCLPEFVGTPPNCRPECTSNDDCSNNLACINQKCRDPCPGSCGVNANCIVTLHIPNCQCPNGMAGDPFRMCYERKEILYPKHDEPKNPCRPSPCGSNAECRTQGSGFTCECVNDYIGNPYEGCRPECVGNSECPANRACIRQKCVDPCPGTCGTEAVCSINNHIPICSCPPDYTGNAFVQCSPSVLKDIPVEKTDPCYPTPCGQNTICKVQRGQAECQCLPGFFGNPYGQECRPECTLSSDCAKNKACVNNKCVDPCPGVCGYGAICQTVNHNPICSCRSSMVGNPFVECHEAPKQLEPVDPCNPSPCRSNGICRVINGVASCSYPECVVNEDCSRDRTCVNQKCRDPCINACGLNAICNAINHKAVCTCPPGYYGSAYSQCLQQVDVVPAPRPECTSDNDCSNDKACVNQQCKNPCELENICGKNARCHVQLHRPLCVCNEGFTGNALNNCYLIGCRSDDECPATEACINKQCADPCLYTQCGVQAVCRSDYNHKARCHCPDGYRGNPLVNCERPECTRNDECAFNLACRNERCEDPCNCGVGAQCRVNNHQAQCKCPPGYVGNPEVRCEIEEAKVAPQCTMDSDCSSKLACFSGECKNPCMVTKPCGANAICSVEDTLPLRTMICECESGFVGDADVGCRKEPVRDQGCQSSEDCPFTEACRSGNCVNPCIDTSPCARTAECLAQQHRAVCTCPQGTQGDPFTNCYQPPQILAGCTHDSECTPNTACINKRCQDPCAEGNPCAGNAECRVLNSRPICYCPSGWGGDPQVQCFKPECKINADCPYDKACINENCVNPCTYGNVRCGLHALCEPQNHQAICVCPAGTQGNPFISCITGHCQYNEDCADHEACDRLNRICRPVCDEDTCAVNGICLARRHQPQCQCRSGYTGNPYQDCVLPKEPPTHKPEPECTLDADCPLQLACINHKCVNPCATPHVCTPQQTCTVLDTLPLRTMICKCPSDTITDTSGNCVPIRHDVVAGCQHNQECANTEVCQRGSCIDACHLERCGVNAQCLSKEHYAQCSCPKGYAGNPRVECRYVAIEQPKTPGAECMNNDDCPNDKTCHNERCINPCIDEPCGRGAFCHVQQREAVCRCPPGYSGDARQACIPPRDVITVGCKSNSDCQQTESCINDQCVNPCNCGPNSECQVRNHHPICYCKPGFSGNAQYGCIQIGCQSDDECSTDQQCVNRECVNPCLISDPCAVNAVCYGRNHRATCRCPVGMQGDPFVRCIRVECNSDYDCASNQACIDNLCINPCRDQDNPCAQNALCQALQHRAVCRCPDYMPLGNPYAYCERRQEEPVCRDDGDCPSGLACIDVKCQNPCAELSPCASSAKCSVLDSIPVRTMVCECPASYVPDARGECKQLVLQTPGCVADSDCSDQEACINRQCRNPCNCGSNAVCQISNHRAICSCQDGFEGNPYTMCRTIGCRVDSECDSGKACVNNNCINPCLVSDPCGINAECYVQSNRAQCRCKSGYRGNAYERCRVIGCQSNNDCPSDKFCMNEQCVNPCVYQNTCSPRAECRPQNHLGVCRCPTGFLGNPYVDCRPEPQPACRQDTDCASRLACINDECVDPCLVLEPCNKPAHCSVTPTAPVRTMICVCPDGYISSGSGTCKPTKSVIEVGGCIADSDCPADKSCLNGVCRDVCNCGINAECRIKDHKPVCTCRQGYEGNPEFECSKVECFINSDCPSTHTCSNQLCVPACQGEQCGVNAQCLAVDHRAVCECIPGFRGNARVSCIPLGCRVDDDCPSSKACVNGKCTNPCDTTASCAIDEICKVYQHKPQCACPPGTIARRNGCEPFRDIPICQYDGDCPSQTACIRGECINPCNATQPCGVNAKCRILDTVPVRTMICECLEGYTGNAAVQCDKRSLCVIEKGFVRDIDGQCICPPGTALDIYEYCSPCLPEQGFKIDETGHCVCALERGFVIDERGRCICPTNHGYRLTTSGECIPEDSPECNTNDDCADNRYCHTETKTCEDPCLLKTCGINAFCNTINHRAQCQCITGYTGNPDTICNHTNFRTDFPRPDMVVSCLADGVQVEIHITEPGFNGVLYVKGHSKDEECRRVVNLAGETVPRTEIFRVHFGSCGMQAVKDIASFVLVIQKHPKLVTYKAQAYNIKCVYQTGEKNVTLGFNVSMLTTAGTIANTGPPPICQMRIITHEGEEINSAEIGDNLKLQVDVEPATIYGGFARSCIAKTMEDNVENEYIVTDENGCATDPSIFGEWEYNPDTNSLLANFNAFKFPSSDNIRFQCNIRVCFGKCQPVNCRGYNAFGRRRRRAIADNSTDDATAIATNTGIEGQLREEITISSNAILTFEKRTTSTANDANIKPAAQRVEDICVSMVGLIIALVITALLALVAVAVAVSCWLMAYRRRPKALAPLPHPPEFPNPLFTNPEAVPEPTPDYLS